MTITKSNSAQYLDFNAYPTYHGSDLGLTYNKNSSTFKIWSPFAEKAEIIFYKSSLGNDIIDSFELEQSTDGTWVKTIKRDLKNLYYVFRVNIKGKWYNEVPDPYAKAVGTNGKRAMVVDLDETDPVHWDSDQSPKFSSRKNMSAQLGGLPTDAIIYEMHIRDLSIHQQSGISQKGKFLGMAETGTKNIDGLSTGLDHLKELGVTHIHLLPSYDFYSIDETNMNLPQYNWGYDPLNYNAPEGSYSTDPENGAVRIKEFKTMIASMHHAGLRVVMDVVYNHTMLNEESYFNQLVPGYFYRQKEDGSFSNASACGNETASERPMMRNFMIESLKYWVQEYHVDGFRFDLMGIHDIETMNMISKELHRIKPDILLYGEGWTAGSSPLPDSLRALKKNAHLLNGIAVFSDDLRDGIKGSVFDHLDKGFATGKTNVEESVRFGIAAACEHPQLDYTKVNYSKEPYAKSPSQVISYCECHDNHVLWDKIFISNREADTELRRDMHKLSLTIVLASQGISFIHAGTEFLRSKKEVENSFKSPDSINSIDWSLKSTNKDVFDYVKGLIQMRKSHPAFRLIDQKEITEVLSFRRDDEAGIITFSLDGKKVGDDWKNIFVAFNGNATSKKVSLPSGNWKIFVTNNQLYKSHPTIEGVLNMKPFSATIIFKD
jgi:pullulanase